MQYRTKNNTNQDVAQSWRNGFPLHSGNMSTDGRTLFSYDLKIGYTDGDGHKVAIDYTRDGGHYISMTTSHHVGIANRYATKVVKPPKR